MARNKNKNRRKRPELEVYAHPGGIDLWNQFMEALGEGGGYQSKTQCKKALRSVWINILDFSDALKSGDTVRRFASRRALVQYTLGNGRWMPLCDIESGSPLAALLTEM